MEQADVLIVGGGPAGSSCAGRLRAAGLDVLVLDKAAFPRDKPCAGWITPEVWGLLGLDPETYAQGRTLQPIWGFRVGVLGGHEREVRYREPISYGIRRCEFDDYLLKRSGARLRRLTVKDLRREGDRWIVNDEVRAPVLVGAGGHFCPVASRLNGRAEPERIVAAQEVEIRLDPDDRARCAVAAEIPELFFCRDLRGYGWCFRKGDHLNVGLGRRDPHGLGAHVAAFVAFLRERRRIPELSAPFKGHAYLLYEAAPHRLVDDGVLIAGDAAALAHPESGEGIGPAVESGLLAAETLIAARGRYDHSALHPYIDALAARRGRRRRRPEPPGPLATLVGGALLGRAWFSRRVVLDRWFLRRAG